MSEPNYGSVQFSIPLSSQGTLNRNFTVASGMTDVRG